MVLTCPVLLHHSGVMKLAAFIEEVGLSPAEFARSIGVNERESIRRYLRGERIPTPRVMRRIIAATEGRVSPTDFFQTGLDNTPSTGGESYNRR